MTDLDDSMSDSFLMDDILGLDGSGGGDPLESDAIPAGRSMRISPRRRFERLRQRRHLADVIGEMPRPGESVHIIGDGASDFWTHVPGLLAWIGRTETLYCSTWTLSRPNAVEMFDLYDSGAVGAIAFLTGLYFKRRETAIYTMLLDGIRARGGRYRAFRNHAKVLLLDNPAADAWLTVEGSANLTANPRMEQYVITNDRSVYDFHRGWMEEMFAKDTKGTIDI
jgi:hypothetical protein